jgi:hypothetical protein
MKFISVLFLSCLWIPCKTVYIEDEGQKSTGKNYTFRVSKAEIPPSINADWNTRPWKSAQNLRLSNFMGERPSHFPETKVKLLYDDQNIYVIFKVRDRYVRAIEKEINGKVWMDSCVEFFFSPGGDTERGYFNFEANCKGVFLFQYHLDNGQTSGFVSREDCEKVRISHSLSQNVEQEIAEPLEWRLEYSIPISVLKKYMKVEEPGPGVNWRANFYKCADKTSHPHWLTWSPVDYPRPKFHLPEFFGKLVFE